MAVGEWGTVGAAGEDRARARGQGAEGSTGTVRTNPALFATALTDKRLGGAAVRTLAAIAALLNEDPYPGQDAVAALVGASLSHANRAIARLARCGYLEVVRRRDARGRFLPSGYRLRSSGREG